jgi:hypothetical protein
MSNCICANPLILTDIDKGDHIYYVCRDCGKTYRYHHTDPLVAGVVAFERSKVKLDDNLFRI